MTVQTPIRRTAIGQKEIVLRDARREDAGAIGTLLHSAFGTFQTHHGFEPDFASPESAALFALSRIDDPLSHAVVAMRDAGIVGVNFLSEGDPIRGVGPIAVSPVAADMGIGRRLMHHVLDRAGAAPGVRLLQDTFNLKSLALYTTLGFRSREPYVVLKGRLRDRQKPDREVRQAQPADLADISDLSFELTGFPRGSDVRRSLSDGSPYVVVHNGNITGYATDLRSWASGHAVAASEEDFRALVLGVNAALPSAPEFLFPVRQAPLLRWLLSQGMRGSKQMLLMTRGAYREPDGIYIPSVLY